MSHCDKEGAESPHQSVVNQYEDKKKGAEHETQSISLPQIKPFKYPCIHSSYLT